MTQQAIKADTIKSMIKAITYVQPAGKNVLEAAEFTGLKAFFAALGFEPGKGWKQPDGEGASFIAPLGNLEFVTGRLPAVPSTLVEVLYLEDVHRVAKHWAAENASHKFVVSEIEPTHWGSRMFIAEAAGMQFGFWQAENIEAGKPAAIEGDLIATGMKFAIVSARWNAVITDRLVQGAMDALTRSGARRNDVRVVRVPGAWEVPQAARALAESKEFDAIIALGCLLRGETAHYEAIYNEVARGIGESQQATGIPHAFGVLTCETLEQALDRAGLKAGNKGFEAACAAIEMVSLTKKIKDGRV
jgi:6,7-dimethyl-8-ribityllumazine synthase